MHRALLLVLFGLGEALALAAVVAILVSGKDFWLIPVAVVPLAGSAWLIGSVRRG